MRTYSTKMSKQEIHQQSSASNRERPVAHEGVEVTLDLITALKREIDYSLRVDLQHATSLADVAYKLSLVAESPLARALGVRAKAQSLHATSRHAEALEYYHQAREIYQGQDCPVEAARVARAMVDALMYQGKYEQALALAAEARKTFETHGEKILLAQLETNLGNIYHRLDRYQQALNCYKNAAAIFKTEGDTVGLAVATYNAANIYCCLDDFREAQALYEQAYQMYSAQGMELAATEARYALGYLLFLIGDFHQAVRVLREVRTDFLRLGRESWAALCDLDLAEIYLQLNVIGEAAEMAASATNAFASLAMKYEEAKALALLGLARFRQNAYAEAERLFGLARENFIREGNDVYQGLTDLYLADLALADRQPDLAFDLATKSERVFRRNSLEAKRSYAEVIRAKALSRTGRAEEATHLLTTVIEGNAAIAAPWLEYRARELYGDLLLESGDRAGAYREYARAVQQIERMRGGIRVDEYRSAFFKDKVHLFEKLIRLCLDPEAGLRPEDAFYYLESCKARTLIDQVLKQFEGVSADAAGIPAEYLDRWRRIREELNWFYNKVGRHEPATDSRRLVASPGDWEEIRQREQALADVMREIQIRDPHFAWLGETAGITAGELQTLLGEDEVLLEYYFDGEDTQIFVIDRNGLRIERSPCKRAQLKMQVMKLQLQLGKFHYGDEYIEHHASSLLESVNACLGELYEGLIAPVRSLLKRKRLIFIPFGFLHNVPFQALFDGAEYLLDRFEVGVAPSARLFAQFVSSASPQSEDVLIIGAADARTPKINEEVQAIRSLYPNALSYSGAEATTRRLTEQAGGKKIVHIASHAVFRHDNPMFSAFQLSDGWLNFYDLSGLDLRGSLVTLSGCNTGSNRVYAGDEMIGMVRGFLSAGASSLVVSLWDVNDQATAQLMKAFYGELQTGAAPLHALRSAELQVKRQYPHPYYWAPFLFMGGAAPRPHSIVSLPPKSP